MELIKKMSSDRIGAMMKYANYKVEEKESLSDYRYDRTPLFVDSGPEYSMSVEFPKAKERETRYLEEIINRKIPVEFEVNEGIWVKGRFTGIEKGDNLAIRTPDIFWGDASLNFTSPIGNEVHYISKFHLAIDSCYYNTKSYGGMDYEWK